METTQIPTIGQSKAVIKKVLRRLREHERRRCSCPRSTVESIDKDGDRQVRFVRGCQHPGTEHHRIYCEGVANLVVAQKAGEIAESKHAGAALRKSAVRWCTVLLQAADHRDAQDIQRHFVRLTSIADHLEAGDFETARLVARRLPEDQRNGALTARVCEFLFRPAFRAPRIQGALEQVSDAIMKADEEARQAKGESS